MRRAEAAPRVGHSDALGRGQERRQPLGQRGCERGVDVGGVVVDVQRPAHQDPPVGELGADGLDRPGQSHRRGRCGDDVPLDPVRSKVEREARQLWRGAGGEDDGARLDEPRRGLEGAHAPVSGHRVGDGDARGDAGHVLGQPRDRLERVHTGLAGDAHPRGGAGQPRDELRDVTRAEGLGAGRGPEPGREGLETEPVDVDEPDPAVGRVDVTPLAEAPFGETNEPVRIDAAVRSRREQAQRTAARLGAEPHALEEEHVAQTGTRAGRGGRRAKDPTTDDDDVGSARQVLRDPRLERSDVVVVEEVAPDRVQARAHAVQRHDLP